MTSALDHHAIGHDHGPSSRNGITRVGPVARPLGRLLLGLAIAALIGFLALSAITGDNSGTDAALDGRGKWSGYAE